MNYKITTFVLIVMCASPIFAQQSNMDYTPLQPFVPSGILYENNPSHIFHNPSHLNHPMHFLGDDDSLCTASIFKDLYGFFYYANFDTATQPLPIMPTVLNQTILNTDVNPEVKLGLMHINFEAISAEALTNNLLTFDTINNTVSLDTGWIHIQDTAFVMDTTNMVIIDTIIRDTLVYHDADSIASIAFDTHTLFAATAYNPWIELESLNDNVTFSLDFINFFSNITINPNEPYRISLDGVNFIDIFPNNPPVSFSGHTFLEGYNQIYIRQGSPHENEFRVRTNFFVILKKHVPDYQMDDFSHVECPDLDYSAGIGSGVVTFKINDLSGGFLKKPVIIVENFEMERNVDNINSSGTGNISSANRTYGVVGWNSFSSGLVPTIVRNPYENGEVLVDSLISKGYDIVFVDFKTTRAKVRQNANFLMKVIQHVNVELRNHNSDEEIAVLGMGTGGVVARVALREMELQSCCHNTRMFTSFDSPHRGLNIPLGIQAFLQSTSFDFYNVPLLDLLRFYNQVIKSPLIEELMIYNYDTTSLVTRQKFQAYLDSIGMPLGSRNFAIINGSDIGEIQKDNSNILLMNPDSAYFTMKLDYLVPTAINFTQGYNRLFNNLTTSFILAYASPKVLGHNNSSNQQIILERGPDYAINNQHRRNYTLSWWVGMAIYTITALAYVAAILNFLPIKPLIQAAEIITLALIQGAWNGQLNSRLADNHSLNPHPDYAVFNPYFTQSYDRAPGGRNDLSLRLSRISNGILGSNVNVLHNHSLIPTVSALNLDTNAINMNIKAVKDDLLNERKIMFEDYHAPTEEGGGRDNEIHTLLTVDDGYIEGNIEWFVDKLNQTRSTIVTNPQTIITLQNETMNYGIPFDKTIAPEKYLRNMEILENGKLGVNILDHVGFPFQNFNFPSNQSNFLIFTQAPECGGTYCKVDSLGVFQIGEYVPHNPSSSTTGNAIFLENSTLELLSGAKLKIEDNSSLIIEEGATLIIHPNAIIELNGGNAILEIKGKVIVKDNAIFTYTSQNPSNYGHVIFNQRRWEGFDEIPVTEYWEIGDNAQMVFEGPGHHANVLVECKRSLRTSTGSSMRFSLIKIRNGAMHIHDNYNADLTADSLVFEFTTVDLPPNSQGKHKGIQLWGMSNQNAKIRHIHFFNGALGLSGFQIGTQQPLYMHDCNFTTIDTALYFEGGCFDLLRCNFISGERGVKAINSSGHSKIRRCDFHNTIKPTSIESDISSSLEIGSCNFYGNLTNISTTEPAVYNNFTDLKMGCSLVQAYHTAISSKNGTLDLSNGYNRLYPAFQGIDLDEVTGLFLHQGENVFAGIFFHDISGTLANNAQLVTINGKINASQNSFQSGTSGFNTHILQGTNVIELDAPSTYVTEFCPEGFQGQNPYGGLIGQNPTEIEIEYNGIQSFSFALIEATNSVFGNESYETYLYQALTDVQSILDQVTAEIDSQSRVSDQMAYQVGFSMMLNILRKCYHYGVLEAVAANPNATLNSYLQSMSNYITKLISLLPQNSYYDENVAIWEITRAHVFRLGQYHQMGLDALQGISGAISPKTESRKNYWNCVMGWESEMLQGIIPIDQYYIEFASCTEMYSPFIDFPDNEIPVPNDFFRPKDELSIYPNPAQSHIYVKMNKIARPEEQVEVTITGMDGKVLMQRKEYASYLIGINVENLAQGSYTLSITTPHKTHNGKFVIVR